MIPIATTRPSQGLAGAARLLGGVAVLVSLLAGCQPETPLDSPQEVALDTAALGASLDSLAAVVTRANETGNAELFASTWAREGAMSAPGQPLVQGRDAIVAAFRRQPALPPGASMTIHPLELTAMNAEWAYAFGVDSLTYTPEGASASVTETSTFLVLIRKTAEGWQTYREVLSPNQ